MAGDPLGNLLLEPADMYRMTRHLIDGIGAQCDGRVVALLEGTPADVLDAMDPEGSGLVSVDRAVILYLADHGERTSYAVRLAEAPSKFHKVRDLA